jgi:hypothetical protein
VRQIVLENRVHGIATAHQVNFVMVIIKTENVSRLMMNRATQMTIVFLVNVVILIRDVKLDIATSQNVEESGILHSA